MELRNMQTFLLACELGSFSKAAERLSYAQSTVTVHIQQLEQELGVPLFERIGKRIIPSEQGWRFYHFANEMLQLEQKAKQALSSAAEIKGTLRFGVVESLLNSFIVPHLPEYHQRFPQVSLELTTDSTTGLMERLKHNELDLVLVFGDRIMAKDCVCADSIPEPLLFVASPANPLAQAEQLTLEQVLRQPLILTEKNSLYRRTVETWAASRNISFEPIIQVDNTLSIASLVQADLGVSFLPEYVVRDYIKDDTLAVLPVTDGELIYWSQVFYHKNKWCTPQMQGMIQLIHDRSLALTEKRHHRMGE